MWGASVNVLPEVDRTEAALWEAIRALYGPGGTPSAEVAARASDALKAYRAALAARATNSEGDSSARPALATVTA